MTECQFCDYEAPSEDFMYPDDEGDMMTSYHFKCPKCKKVQKWPVQG